MICRLCHRPLRTLAAAVAVTVVLSLVVVGCKSSDAKKKKTQIAARYTALPAKKVPPFLKDTVFEHCDLLYTEPYVISGYGLAVNLDGTGDSIAPNRVREYIVNEMVKHKWGSSLSGIKMPSPDEALRDPRVAIVQVDAYLPPGVRRGQPFDAQASALTGSNTSSLAGGAVLETDLRIDGANPQDPGGSVNALARTTGEIFVNPAYVGRSTDDPAVKRSLRFGVIMNGCRSLEDRPLGLRLRTPSMRMSRYIEDRIDNRFQEIKPDTIAAAQDEAIVQFYVPMSYNGDWEHFSGVVTHLYLNNSTEFATVKARELADEAIKPDAPLMDISYCWEGLGKSALPVIRERELMSHANPDVAYAAARAAAFLGDQSAPQVLVNMARTKGHPFQINAIQVLGALQSSPAINEMLRPLLNSDETLVRLEAYKMLARNGDNSIFSRPLKAGFSLDVIRSEGPPVVYATRRGTPSIAVIGKSAKIEMPVTFTAMDGRLSISSDASNRALTIFYRPAPPPRGVQSRKALEQLEPIRVVSQPDLDLVIAHLAGEGPDNQRKLNFNYAEIVSILNKLLTGDRLTAVTASSGGKKVPASFILEELPQAQDSIYSAPVIGDQGRPQADEPGRVGMAK